MGHVVKVLAALLAITAAVLLIKAYAWPGDDGSGSNTSPPPVSEAPGLTDGVRKRLEAASDLAAPDLYREAMRNHTSLPARRELLNLFSARAERALASLERQIEEELHAFRYAPAARIAVRFRRAWAGTDAVNRATALLEDLRAEQADQVADREEEALALMGAGRYEAARDSLRTAWELEETYRRELTAFAATLERRIRVHQHEATRKPPRPVETTPTGRPATVKSVPSSPPALPGYPHADVKRLADAKGLLGAARSLFQQSKYQPAVEALDKLLGYYGDLAYVERRRDAVGAMTALAGHKAKGVSGLFHATSATRRGRKVKLVYRFEGVDEYGDWEALQTIPHKHSGEFAAVRNGVRGTGGSACYVHYGVFENDVTIRCIAKPQRNQTHGLVFCQDGLETRQLMWIVTNHWFVEGENYKKARPGHSILMFGKGVNADVPVDSPDIGFIFRGGSIMKPWPREGAEIELSFALKSDQMAGEITYKRDSGGRRGSAVGDDGRGMERTRPGLIVIENSVTFREIVIEGRLHPSFEAKRVGELLEIASGLD
jgi:tetratricopeptide (TPR) repeat protein